MDNLTRIYLLNQIRNEERIITDNAINISLNRERLKVNKKQIKRRKIDIVRNIVLFIASSFMSASLIYGVIIVNREVKLNKVESTIDKSEEDLYINDNDSEETIIAKVIKLISICIIFIGADLAYESMYVKLGLNTGNDLGFIASIKDLNENIKVINKLKKDNKDYNKEINILKEKSNLVFIKYNHLIKELNDSNKLVKEI